MSFNDELRKGLQSDVVRAIDRRLNDPKKWAEDAGRLGVHPVDLLAAEINTRTLHLLPHLAAPWVGN